MDPFIGEIRMFCGNFAPRGWALCNGQILPISQNAALFSILGTTYGGNGTTNFQLPNFQSRLPMHAGTGPGLSTRSLGEAGGAESVNLTLANLPSHNHTAVFTPVQPTVKVDVSSTTANLQTPVGNLLAVSPTGGPTQATVFAPSTATIGGQLAGVSVTGGGGNVAIGLTGNNTPAPTLSPFLVVNFIIATEGVFPSRN